MLFLLIYRKLCSPPYLLFIFYTGDKFEGDMLLNPDQINAVNEQDSKNHQFAAIKANHWKRDGVAIPIPYFFSYSLG